jgi:hypothetical protein
LPVAADVRQNDVPLARLSVYTALLIPFQETTMPGRLPNLSKLGPAELQAVYQDAKRRLAPHLKQRIAALEAEMRELEGLHQEITGKDIPVEVGTGRRGGSNLAKTASTSSGHGVGNGRRARRNQLGNGKSPLAGRKIEPKYRDPENRSQTWAGRGQPPKWLTAYEASGRKRDDFLIGAAAAPARTKGRRRK